MFTYLHCKLANRRRDHARIEALKAKQAAIPPPRKRNPVDWAKDGAFLTTLDLIVWPFLAHTLIPHISHFVRVVF